MNVLIGPYKDDNSPRQIEIRIDKYDTWGMDHTLALLIVPMLKQLKATKQGAPNVDDDDVPNDIKSSAAPKKEFEWDIDIYHFRRWDYVMDEMIWAMEQIVLDNESQFFDHSEVDEDADINVQIRQIKSDWDGLKQYQQRIQNGCRLFGKYFQALWD